MGWEILGGMANTAFNSWLNQSFAKDQQEDSQQFNAEQAAENRAWQQMMMMNRYQFTVQDLKKANLNPMLAYGASPPAGGSGATASSGISSAGPSPDAAHGTQAFSAANLNTALVNKANAETDRTEAEAAEIRARTPRHEVDIREVESRIPRNKMETDLMHQKIGQSAVEIEKIWQDTATSAATAKNITQQTENLKAAIPHIKAQIDNLKALSAQASATTDEIKQRIKSDLPGLERTLGNLEKLSREMEQTGHANQERAADSLAGQIGAYLRQVNPLQGFIGVTPGRRSSTHIHNYGRQR